MRIGLFKLPRIAQSRLASVAAEKLPYSLSP